MFGYININQEELSEESKKTYQAYYCGLCRKLKESCGIKGQMLLNYDITFLIVLLTGLYELSSEEEEFTCGIHPTKKQKALMNEATSYAADMNVVLAYQSFKDDCRKEKSISKSAMIKMLEKDCERIRQIYPRQTKAIEDFVNGIRKAENANEANLDLVSGLAGEMLSEIFAWKEDHWSEELKCLGFYLGKFVFLMDSYEDIEVDCKRNEYNPLTSLLNNGDQVFETYCKLVLTSMISECAKSFERLPVLMHADILRNILYSGVWSKYQYIQSKKSKKSGKDKRKTVQNNLEN